MKFILLMTAGNNVLNWYNNGSYGREIKLYKVLANFGVEIIIFDYISRSVSPLHFIILYDIVLNYIILYNSMAVISVLCGRKQTSNRRCRTEF